MARSRKDNDELSTLKEKFTKLMTKWLDKSDSYVTDFKDASQLVDIWYRLGKHIDFTKENLVKSLWNSMFISTEEKVFKSTDFQLPMQSDAYWPQWLLGTNQAVGVRFTIDILVNPDDGAKYAGAGQFKDENFMRFSGDSNVLNYSTRVETVARCSGKMFLKGKGELTTTPRRVVWMDSGEGKAELKLENTNEQLDYEDPSVVMRIPHYGIELETLIRKGAPEDISSKVLDDLDGAAILKGDGSISTGGCSGFEIVSVPATFLAHKELWAKFFDEKKGAARHLRSWNTGRCGIHIHISRVAFTRPHLARFAAFINHKLTRKFVTDVAGRSGNSYCPYDSNLSDVMLLNRNYFTPVPGRWLNIDTGEEYSEEDVQFDDDGEAFIRDDNDDIMYLDPVPGAEGGGRLYDESHDRRRAVNFCNRNTIEVRIFRGNVKKAGFFKCLEFTDAVFNYTKDCGNQIMGVEDFITWVQKNNYGYGNLVKWLIANDYITTKKTTVINWRKECA